MTKEELLEYHIMVAEEDSLENLKYLSSLGFKLLYRYKNSKHVCLVSISDIGTYYGDLKDILEVISDNDLFTSNLRFNEDGTLYRINIVDNFPYICRIPEILTSLNPPSLNIKSWIYDSR